MFGTNATTEMQSSVAGSNSRAELTRGVSTGQWSSRDYPVWARWKMDWKKSEQSLILCSDNKRSNMHVIRLLEEKRKGRVEKYFMKIMAENISHFARELDLQIQ